MHGTLAAVLPCDLPWGQMLGSVFLFAFGMGGRLWSSYTCNRRTLAMQPLTPCVPGT